MNKQIFLTLALSAFLLTANAQNENRGPRHGQGMKSERRELTPEQRAERTASRIAGELMLDDAGSSKFKSIYKDYQLELGEVNKKYMPERSKKEEGVNTEKKSRTDKEIEDGIKNRFAHQRALLDVEEKYYTKFRTVLNARQVEKVYRMSGKGRMGFSGKGRRGGFGHGPQMGQGFGFRGHGGQGFGGQRGGRGFGPHRGQGPKANGNQNDQSTTDSTK